MKKNIQVSEANKNYSKPIVSVCIPTYNRCSSLEKTIDSLYQQTFRNFEILISDNASTDSTRDYCLNLLENIDLQTTNQNISIRYFRQKKNLGPIHNFNFAKSKVRGDYFIWLGDDDRLDNNYIDSCIKSFDNREELVLVSGTAAYHKNNENQVHHFGNHITTDFESKLLRIANYILRVADNSIFCGLYKTEKIKNLDVPNGLAGDWIWLVEILLTGSALMLKNIHIHRSFGDSTSSSYSRIVKTLEEPKWKASWPWLAMFVNFMTHFINMVSDNNILRNITMLPFILICFILKIIKEKIR